MHNVTMDHRLIDRRLSGGGRHDAPA
jgi:hypothetical protein